MVVVNLETGFACRVSPVMKDFLTLCEDCSTDEAIEILQAKHPGASLRHFFRRVERHAPHLFIGERVVGQKPSPTSLWLSRRTAPFTAMTLNITHACNLRCDYCFEGIEFRRDAHSMQLGVALKATDLFLAQLNGEPGTIVFTGGEPLLCLDTVKSVVTKVRRSYGKVSLIIKTNATLMDRETISYLVSEGFCIQISLDGQRETHDHHRKDPTGRGTFDRVFSNIMILLSEGQGTEVNLHGTVTRQTVHSIRDNLDYLNSLGATHATIKPVMGNLPFLALDGAEFEVYCREVYREAVRVATRMGTPKNLTITPEICGIGIWHFAVDVDGSIYPCYRLSGISEYRMGHLDEGIKNWLPSKLEMLYDWDQDSRCGPCTKKVLCRCGCYAEKLLGSRSRCNSMERIVGERMMEQNLASEEVRNILPVL